jgi:hypothetical protein
LKYIVNNFQPRLFAWIFIGFIISTIAGTLSHESGHYLMAKILGYSPSLRYAYTTYGYRENKDFQYLENVSKEYNNDFEHMKLSDREKYYETVNKIERNKALLTIGGPLQIMLTGTIGLIFLFFLRKKYYSTSSLSIQQWIPVFLSLFWLRQSAKLAVLLAFYLFRGSFIGRSDETFLAQYFNVPLPSIALLTGIAGFIILIIVVFRFIPERERLTFLAGGFTGGIAGYILWLNVLGPRILP